MNRQTIHQWWINIKANAKSRLHILGIDHQLFGKQSKKSGEILHWKKRRLPEYVTKVIKNLFSNAIFKSLIEKWLIYHKEKELIDFWLKIRIFEISKFKIFEKNIFTGKLFMWPYNIICWNFLTLRYLDKHRRSAGNWNPLFGTGSYP